MQTDWWSAGQSMLRSPNSAQESGSVRFLVRRSVADAWSLGDAELEQAQLVNHEENFMGKITVSGYRFGSEITE